MTTNKNLKKIYVTEPSLPPLNEYCRALKKIWDKKWITNKGEFHQKFEQKLCAYLGVKYCSLTANGTLALIIGLKALKITGEVITTPYSFAATAHALLWNNLKPVFCDIKKQNYTIDPDKIEALITPRTSAILGVHVYGHVCDFEKIKTIAKKHNLRIIYDAAHSFGVKIKGKSILDKGDLSILSFHATKTFNTVEGGAILTNSLKIKREADLLRNFGILHEAKIVNEGLNAKMNELQAAYGLIQLKQIKEQIAKRKKAANYYFKKLRNIKGIKLLEIPKNEQYNYHAFPVMINKSIFGISRDKLLQKFNKNNIFPRRYFYPLLSGLPMYKKLQSAGTNNLINARQAAENILCLPLYSNLKNRDIDRIVQIIIKK